jgi:hypothetical protein
VTQQPESGAKLIVTVTPDGLVTAQTQGILGERCLEYIVPLEDLVGGQTITSEYTADFGRVPQAQQAPDTISDVELA